MQQYARFSKTVDPKKANNEKCIKKFMFFIILILIGSSCSRARDYKFQVYNDTDYNIETFEIGNGNDKITTSVSPSNKTAVLTYHFGGTTFNFTEPILGLHIKEYSDSTDFYENNIGSGISVLDLNKKETNVIHIGINENDIDYIFTIKTN